MNCRSACVTKDHRSFGECARAAHLRVGWAHSAKGIDLSKEKRFQRELDVYEAAVNSGMNPDATTFQAVHEAEVLSEGSGVGYGTPAWDSFVQNKLSEDAA